LTIDELIDQLQANGYKNHSRAAFKQKLYNSPSFRRELYDANGFKSHGIGYKDFESKLNINNGTIAQSNSEYEEDKRTKSIDDGADKDGQGVIDFAQNVVRHVTDGLMSSSSGLSKAIGNTAISLYGGVTGSDMTNTHAEFNKSMDDARDKLQALMGSPINYISDQIDSDDEDAAAAKSVKRYKEEREAQNKRYELEVWDDTKGVGENIVSLPYKVLSQPVEALSIALSTTGDIFLAKSSVGTRFFGMGVDGAYDELKKINAENPDLHLDDHPNIALGYSASVGVIQGLFEKYSVDKILGPAASKRAANYVLNKAVREITKRGGVITTELLEKEVAAVSRRIGTKVGAAALNTLVATGVEGSEELFTEMGNDAIRIMTNHIGSGLGIDGDIFDIDEMKNTAAERYLTNFAAGAVGGAGLGMTHGLFNNSSDYIRYTYATENNKDEARAQIDSEIQNSRKYSDEMKSALLGYSELMHDMSTKIDNDADIDTKKKMMALLGSKSYQISKVQSLEQKIATIDDSLKEAQQPLLDREKAKLAHINNVILATYKGNDLVYDEKDGQYTKTIGDETSTISELEYMIGSVAQLQDKRKDGDATDDEDGSFADDDADLISDLTRGVEAVSDIPVEVIKPLDVGTKIEYNGVRGEVVEIDRLKDGSIRSIKLKDDDGNDTFVFINGKDIEEYGIQIISDENTRQTNDDGSVGEENQSEAQTEDGGISEGESTITAVEGEPSDIGIADDDGSTKEGQKEQEPLYKSDPGYVSELEKEHSRLTKERDEYISDIAELKAIDPTFDENGEETAKAQRIYDDGIKNAEEKARTNSINKRRDADIKKAKDIGKRKGIDVTKTIENINKKYDEELGENQKENEVGHTKVSRVLDSQIDDENFPRENIESHPIFQSNARKAKESKGRAEGKAFKKTLANGEVITGKYILINKNDVFASHRAHSFSKTPGVPVNKNGNTFNDNDYERSKTAQAKQIKDANNYDQRAIEDPVLIDRNGVVKSGNGRTISRQMSNAKSSQKYTNELKERAEEFGFTKEQVEAIGDEDVMLAVELDGDPVYTTKEYAKYNEDSTKKKTPTEDAIVKAKSLDEKTISQMASVFEDSDVMSDLSLSDIDRLRNILINNGVISETNQSLYFDENGKLTASGSELIENILLASIFNENEIRTLSKLPSIRKKLAQNRVRLLNNRRKEETSVINLVRRAISIIGLSTSYSGSFEDKLEQYITQSDMFDVVDSDKDVVLMAILINDASKFRQLLDSLNNIVEGEDLFGNTIDSASVLSSVYDMVQDELSDKQKLVLEKAGYNINIEEYEKQEEGNETVSDKGKDGLTSGRQEGNIGTVSDGKNKSETGGKENDRKKEGVDEVDRGKDISYESDTSSKKKDSTEDVVNKDVKEAEEVGKDEKDKKTEASDSTDFEATDKKNVSRGEVGLGFKEILQRTPLSNDSKKVLQFILKKFPYIANNVDFIEDQKVWDDLVGSDEYGGWYATDDETGRIVILLNPKKKAGRDETILHEVIHAFTQTIIDNPRTAAEREYVAQITELYNKFKSIKGVSQTHAYIYDDIHEFVTYTMTNTPFQRFLRNRLSTRSLFDKVIDAIRNMFGFPSNDIVNKVISSTKAIISTTDYSNIQERILDGYRAQKGAKIDISTQGSNKTNKVYETKVETKSGKGETVQFKSSQGNNDYTSSDNIQREGDKVKSSGIGRTIAGVWNKFKNIQFTGTTKVKNAADVAHIMRLLEDKSVEHAFAVHIDSKGNSHIQFLSIGGISGTVVDPKLVLSGVAKFKSKKVYLVHNHPSGNMTPSNADRNITKNITEGLSSLTTEFEHIIMDTYKQEYLVLDKYGYTDGRFTREKREEGRKLSTHIFDGAKVLTEPLAKITSSSDVAEFLYQKRFSVLPKNGYLILNQQNNIIGNFSFKGDVNVNELLLSFGETATAKSVIMYGNSAPLNLNKISVQLNKLDVGLLDYVEVKGGGNDVKGAYDYISAADSGLLNEVQAKYGTNMVNEPVNDSSESQPITEAESKTLTDWLNKAFGGAVRVLGLDAFNARAKELGVKPIDIKYPDGTVYGAVLPDGSMYLNPKKINANTPIHEHTHLFNQVIQKTNPKLWDKIVEATKKTELWEEVKNDPNYANLKTDSQIADEVFSRFVGDKGEGSWQERIAKADSKSRLAKVGELIKEYWNAIKEFFGVDIYKGMTADDFANMTLDKLFSGKEIKGAEEAIGVKDDKSVVKKMMIGGKEVEVKTLPQVTNGFYSPIEKKLLDEKATNLSATKWLERLGKGDEMQFTGLKDFLESKKPNEQVKKSDIQDFMRDNRIEVVEVVKLDRPFREIKKAFENVGNEWEEVYGGVYAKLSDKSNEYERRYNLKINGVEYGRDFTYLDAKSYVEANAQTNPEKNRSKFSQYQLEGQKENYKEIMIVLPREGSMKKVGDYTVPSAHKYGEDLADNRRVVHLRMNTRTDADGNKVLFLEEVQSDHNQEARKKGVRNEKEMKRISELADLFLEDRTKNQEGTPERIEYEKLTARNNTQGVPDAPFIKDTNATTKLGLKVALKEAVAQGADKISWTTGEQQNERYDLSKQVDEIGWQKNENGTYNITPKKDGSVIGTREMMANLTIKQIEDYVGKEVAEKIQNEEGKVWDGGSVKQGKLTGQQLKVGGKGMIGFYGNPSEGKLGIVGQVAKSLFKQEPQTIELQNTVTLSGNQNKILRFRDWVWANETKDYSFADAEKDIENNNELYAKYQSSIPTQHAITITPEMRQQVQEGLPLFNVGLDVARFMVKSQLKSDKVMFNISDKYWNDLGKVVNDAKNVEDLNNALDIISDAIFQKYSKKRAVISNNRVRAQVRMLQSTNPREMATVISNAGVMFKTDADDYSEGDLEKLKKPAEDMLTKSRIDIGQKWNEVLKNYPSSVRYLVYRGIYKFISKESEAYPIGYIKEAFDSTIQRFSESDSPQNFDFYTEYNQSIIDLLGEDRDSVINVDTDNGISGTWIKMNKASDSNDIEATKIKVAAASNGTSWCTKQTDTSGTGAKKVIEEDDHDFYVFFPKNTTQATIAIVPIREGEEEQLVNNSWYTGVFKQSNASDNNVDPEYYETVNQLAKKTKDKDLAYTLEKIGYSGLSKEEIKEIQRQKDKVKLDWFENHSGEIFTDEDIEDINRIYGISIIVNGDQLGLHEWTEGIEEQLPESIRKDFGNKLFKSISYIELDANFNGSQVQSLGNLQSIGGNAYFKGSQVQSLGNLQSIGGYANFNGSPITSLGNLQSIGGNAYFEDSQVQSLGNLQSIGGNAYFNGSQVQSLGNLQSIGGYANFNDSQVQSLGILQSIGGYAYFEGSQVQSLGNLQSIGGYAYFNGSQVQSLGNLQSIGGNANFNGSQVQSLGNLQSIGGHAYFNGSQVQSLGNLQSIGGNAYFKGSQVQSLGNLQSIGEYAYFEDSQVQSLGNLQSIGGNAYFKDSQVQSLGNLQSIGGNAYFNGSQVQSLGNLQSIGEYAYFEDSQVQSLGNLQSIGGNAYFNGSPITSLGNLQSIGGNAYFEDSQVQSLGNLQSIGGYANFNDSQVQSLGNLQSIGGDADFMDSKKNIFRLLKTGDNVAKEKALRIKDIFTNAHYSYLANLKNGGDIKLFNDFLPAEFRLRREEIDVNLSHNSDEIRFSMSESAVNQADKAATVGNTDPIGKVVINLNKSGATKEAQIKEFASAWITVMQRQSASFINRGLELVADTEYIKETRGDAMLALQNAIADHTSKLKKTDKLIGWVKSFWVRVGKMLRINISSDRLKEMTIGEFLDIASAQLRYTNDIISELLADSTSDNKAIETEGKKSEENYREESISEREKKLLDEYESLIANMDNEGGKSDTRQNNMSIEEEYDFIGRDLSDNTQALVRTNGKEYDSMLQSLVGSAKKVVETIAFLMPTLKNAGISVTLHKSTSSYYNAVANNGGSAIEATRSFAFYKDGQIHINIHKPGIKANVAIHEALHPIIRDLLVNNKPVFDRFVNDILNDKELRKKYYDDFAMARYSHLDGDKISEEAIIEASADIILARIIKGLDAASDSVFNRVLKYIKEALGKTYGKLFEHVNTRADFNAFANTLADGISKGMVISFNREGKAAIKEIVENAASIADGNNTKNITGEKVDNDDAINNKKQASGLSQSIQDNRSQQKRAIQSKLTADILTNPDINWEHIASKLVTSGVLTKDEVDDILNGWRQKNASVNTVGKNMSSDQTLMAIEGMAELLHLRNMTEDDDVRITHEAMDELVANLDGELSDSLLHYTPYEVKATIKRIADSGLAHPVNILQIFHNVINSGNVPGHEKFIAMGIAISQLKSSLKKYKDIYKKTGDKHSADMVDSINDMLLRLAAASKTASSLSGAALGIHSKLIELGGLTYEGQLIELDGINKRGKNIEIEESDKKQINALVNKINELQAALDKAITSNETKNDGDKEKETTYRTIRKVNAGKQPILSKEVLLAKLRKLRASSTSFSLAMSVSDPSDMSYNEIIVELIKVAHIDGAVTFKDVVEAVKGYDNQITENDIYNAVISQTHESKAKRLSELAQREATTKRHARDIARLEKMIKDDIAALLVNNKVPDTNRMHSIRKLLYDIEKNIYSIDTTGSIMATQQNAIDQIRDNYDIAFLHPSPDKSTEDMLSSIVNAIRMLHDAKYKAWIEETYRNLKKEIDNINEAIKNGTFAKTVSPSNDTRKEIPTHISVPVFDDDGEVIGIDEQEFNYGRILRDISTMRREIEAIKNKYRNSESAYHKWYVRFRNTIGGSMAMMDLSYFAVQGYRALTLFWRNPKMFIQAFSKSISVMADEFSRNPGKADIIYKQIVENPYYQRAVSLGLVISDPEAHIHIKEEIGGDDYFDIIYDKTKNKKGLLASTINVPLKIRKKVKTASNASFATHLNLISINTVSAYIERVVSKTGEQPSDKELEAIIRDVNNSTGRPHFKQGSHGGKIAVGASYVLWAPKLYASQIFNIANIALDPIKLAYYASRGEKDMTRAYMYKAANSVLAFATTTAVIYGLRAMLAKIQCGDNVGYNTEKGTSRSNWMKIQCGDWSFDPTGNHRQWIRLGYNLIKTVQNEPPVDYRGEKISPSQQIFNVLRYKSNPALAFVSSLFTGTDFMNRRYYADDTSPMQIKSRVGVIKDAFIPIFGNNLVDLYKFAMSDNSERLRLKPLVAVEQVLGFGVTYIDPKEKEERKEIEKKEKADSKKEKSEDALQKLIKEGLPKEYSEGEFQDNVDWSNISLTDKQYKSKDGKRRQVFRHISDTNHDGKENDCFVWRTRIRGKRKGEKYKERVPCE
jgi:hypothetical protein